MALKKQKKKIDEAFAEFLRVQTIKKNLKDRTVKEHKIHYGYFISFLSEIGYSVTYVHEVTEEMCADYWEYMRNKVKWGDHNRIKDKLKKKERGLSQSTINLRTRTLKAQFNYFKKKGYIEENPWQDFDLKHLEAQPRYLSIQELFQLFDAIDSCTFEGVRDLALYTFLLDSGARISETLQLNVWDFDLDKGDEGEVHFPAEVTKNGHPRTSPLNKDTITLLKRLFKQNDKIPNKTSFGAFLTAEGKRISYAGVRDSLVRHAKKANLDGAHLHQFRHSFAVHYTLNGGDDASLMQIGGWKAQQTLKRYRKLKDADVKKQHKKFSPTNFLFQ